MSRILQADAFYRLAEHPVPHRNPVSDQAGRRFSNALAKLLGDLQEDAAEPEWGSIVARARQVRWRAATEPVPLDSVFSGVADPLEDLLIRANQLSNHLDHQRQSLLEELIAAADQIQQSANRPFGDAVLECLHDGNPSSTCLIGERQRAVSALAGWLCEEGYELPVFTPRNFMGQARVWDLSVVIGASTWFPQEVFSAPRARQITLIHPDWVRDKDQSHGVFGELASSGITVTIREARKRSEDSIDQTQQISASDVVPQPDWSALAAATPQANAHEQNAVESKPVVLGGGYVVWLPLAGQSIRGLDLAASAGRRVVDLPISAVNPGSILLLRDRDTETRALRPLVDSILGSLRDQVRELQADWKFRLRKALEDPGAAALTRQMKARGARTANLQDWVSEDFLRPRRDEDFRILLQTLGADSPDQYLRAGRALWRAHGRAGHRLKEALEDLVESRDLAQLEQDGRQELRLHDVPGIAAMLAFRVIAVGPNAAAVSSHITRRPIPARGAEWLE